MTTPLKKTAAPRTSAAKAAPAAPSAGSSRHDLTAKLRILQDGGILTPAELHEFLEAGRSLASSLAFFLHVASTQLEVAGRKAARDSVDKRLTLAQKVKLGRVMRNISRKINTAAAESQVASARALSQAWGLMEAFLDELEAADAQRPHKTGRDGFSVFGGK